jgi:hypothetical protein
MPNWTYNNIRVTGPKESLDTFRREGEAHPKHYEDGTEHVAMSSWFPRPETYDKYDTTNHPNGERLVVGEHLGWDKTGPIITEELIEEFKAATKEQWEKHGAIGWYDWDCKNYSCKWDMPVDVLEFDEGEPIPVELTETEGILVLDFKTPWSAPYKWLAKISKDYPDLLFTLAADYETGEWEIIEFRNGEDKLIKEGDYDNEEPDENGTYVNPEDEPKIEVKEDAETIPFDETDLNTVQEF